MGTIKDRNKVNLTEVEDITKRWLEYSDYTKTIIMTQITTILGHYSLRARNPGM